MAEKLVNFIGKCPVCGKGQIAEGPAVYRCDYAASMTDKCDFHIFKTYNGTEITEKHVKQLIENGQTEIMEFTSKAGKKYSAFLKIEGENVSMEFANNADNQPKLDTPCPLCGEPVMIFNNGYGCKNVHETDEAGKKKCSLWINKVIAHRTISKDEVEQLLALGQTDFLDGFESNSGNEFTSRLILDKEGNINFDSTVCKCPKCGGDVKIGSRSYNCSNYKENGCNFNIWKEIAYRKISPEEVKSLCENKATEVLDGFKNKDKSKTFSGQLILSED
ncbi:MAG: topoisomerase C-terminal repeat-containing protein, partial [Bacteroidales bacterium]|nr:topoisomerase C-terminal repeat-containing protein [Bacteroidales bacterium]